MNTKDGRCYYAHCMAIYDTKQEDRDIETLNLLGYHVVNPNSMMCKEGFKRHMEFDPDNPMDYFFKVIDTCDVLAFRSLPDGRIPAGVASEVEYAKSTDVVVFELPNGLFSRKMTVDETREYLRDVGQR